VEHPRPAECDAAAFRELKADLPAAIRRIAAFLDIAIDERQWPAILGIAASIG
jgi:hypothetical protein